MLIRSLRAENFMKFRALELDDIPSRGLVGIVGRNEGGKTTIGELVQFALFGKTLSVERGSILDLIHWDRDHCVVELEFVHEGVFRVWREIDRYGTNYARLLKVDPDDPEKTEEIASGAMPVARALEARLRFSFEDFLRSFYLAERDFPRSPDKMRDFLDRMTGVEVLLAAQEAAGGRVGELEERFAVIQTQVRKNEQQIARYVPNVEKIPELEESLSGHDEALGAQKEEQRRANEAHAAIEAKLAERDGLRDRLEGLARTPTGELRGEVRAIRQRLQEVPDLSGDESIRGGLLEGLDLLDRLGEEAEELQGLVERAERSIIGRLDGAGSDSYQGQERDARALLARSIARRRNGILLSTLSFLIGISIAGVALHDRLVPGSPWLPESLGPQESTLILCGFSAGLALILAAVLAGRASAQRHDIADLEASISRVGVDQSSASEARESLAAFREDFARKPITAIADGLLSIRQEAVSTKAKSLSSRVEAAVQSGEPDIFLALAAREKAIVSKTKNGAKEARKEAQKAAEALKKLQSKRDRVHSEIREYQKQDGRRAELEEKNAQLRKEGAALREEMDVHHLAQELLGETVDSIRHRAGPSLGKGIRKLLPFLTENRYQDLQVTPEFDLKLFTGAKSDFLETHELSGGTLEGLSFGFRLSFAQAFVGAVTRAPQFLFLDEPFRAMDLGRVRKTLAALHRLSDDLPQIFVILPDVESGDRALFDAVIEARIGSPELRLSLDPAKRAPARPAPQPREQSPTPAQADGPKRSTSEEGDGKTERPVTSALGEDSAPPERPSRSRRARERGAPDGRRADDGPREAGRREQDRPSRSRRRGEAGDRRSSTRGESDEGRGGADRSRERPSERRTENHAENPPNDRPDRTPDRSRERPAAAPPEREDSPPRRRRESGEEAPPQGDRSEPRTREKTAPPAPAAKDRPRDEAPPRPPRRATEPPEESPSGFLAGIFDDDRDRS
ncbi:MAG: ATP-binding protein [Planctomycetota bacterium]|jgi:hypothetical protein